MIQCEYCGKRLQEVRTDGACNNCTTLLEELGILRRTLRKLEDGDLYNGMKDLIKIAEEKRELIEKRETLLQQPPNQQVVTTELSVNQKVTLL